MTRLHKFYLAGEWQSSKSTIDVNCPYDGSSVGRVAAATKADYIRAIDLRMKHSL